MSGPNYWRELLATPAASAVDNLPEHVERLERLACVAECQGERLSTGIAAIGELLELLAAVLGCSPDWLLESGRVDADDLAARGRISDAARLIRSHGWTTPLRSPTPAGDASTTAASSLHWLVARDAYLSHVMACRICRAHPATHRPGVCLPDPLPFQPSR